MSNKETGGPAFPMIRDMRHNADWDHEPGMELRDYFAAKAMPIAVKRLQHNWNRDMGNDWSWGDEDWESVANHAYALADAMLEARAS